MIYVVNFPFCNFYSLRRYLRVNNLGFKELTKSVIPLVDDVIILPGVGTFEQGINFVHQEEIFSLIYNHGFNNGFVLGICLGMQMLLTSSDESPGIYGLNLIPGECKVIPESTTFQVPHIGWNELVCSMKLSSSFHQKFLSDADFYFVHSYHAICASDTSIVSSFRHPSGHLAASIRFKNVFGFQFHPEKSGPAGYKLLNSILKP